MYKLDRNNVKESTLGGSFIQEKGSYEGKFIQVAHIKAQSGANGLDFLFQTNDGRKARFTLYVTNASGEYIFGKKLLDKLMYSCRVDSVTSKEIMGMVYDVETKSIVNKPIPQAPELLNKELGILLNVEHYKKQDGTDGKQLIFVESFTPSTGLTSAEEANGEKEPKERIYILENMKERYRKDNYNTSQNSFSSNAQPPKASGVDSLGDDIPF